LVEPEKPNKPEKPDKQERRDKLDKPEKPNEHIVSDQAIIDEQLRMGRLKRVVDITAYWLEEGSFNHEEALSIIEHARGEILTLCPGKEEVFELVIRPRFLRILTERALSQWERGDSLN
jgi:hypothetical protein